MPYVFFFFYFLHFLPHFFSLLRHADDITPFRRFDTLPLPRPLSPLPRFAAHTLICAMLPMLDGLYYADAIFLRRAAALLSSSMIRRHFRASGC